MWWLLRPQPLPTGPCPLGFSHLLREVEKVIRAPLATAAPSRWINSISAYWGYTGGGEQGLWLSGAWISYAASGRVDRFEEGSGFRPTAFRQMRWGQAAERVKSLLALPELRRGSGPRCMALVETGGGTEPLKQALLLWNGASWVPKVRRGREHGGRHAGVLFC